MSSHPLPSSSPGASSRIAASASHGIVRPPPVIEPARSTRELSTISAAPAAPVPVAVSRWTKGRLAIVAGVVLYLVVVLVLPLIALVVETVRAGFPAVVRALSAPDARFAMQQTLWLTLIAVVVNTVLGVAIALVLVRHRFPGRRLLDAVIDLSLAVSPVMIGLAFLLVLGREGWFGPALEALGGRVAFAFPGLVIATLFVTLPYTVREVANVLVEVGEEEEQVASTLGASAWRTFWKVTLPNIRRGVLLGITLTAARALGEFGAVLVLGGAINRKTETATTYIYGAIEERQVAGAYGMALLLGVVSMLLLLAIERFKDRSPDA
ncbi:MAG: sulfate ABC transporter permease subunit [Gemmatimonadetes bacterium]|nr:sulfate ABC transporter permease subunit [Gemmatimonadota bacterium]